MTQFLIALLIPLVLANQGLSCWHVHGSAEASSGLAVRPHVHWVDHEDHHHAHDHGHSHDHAVPHANDEPLPVVGSRLTTPSSHDDAAVLITARDAVREGRISELNWSWLLLEAAPPATLTVDAAAESEESCRHARLRIVRPPKVPVYLRDARILC